MSVQPRSLLAGGSLLLQLALVVHAQLDERRYFCWAPNDYANTFLIQVRVGGTELNANQSLARYHLEDRKGFYENPATHIMDIIRQYEETYGRNDRAEVLLKWRLNGGREQTWRWPGKP